MNYLIVDDEPQARKLLQVYMHSLPHFQLVKLCENALEAYEALHLNRVDLLFLDIKMPLVSGIDFLRSLKEPPLVILTTAYPKYALEGFELEVVDYLLKPIALPRLVQALEKAQRRKQQTESTARPSPNRTHLFLKADHKLVKVDLADIRLIEGMQNYVKVHLTDKILLAAYTMKMLEELLPASEFLRVHRSFIVPIAAITAVHGNLIETAYRDVPIGMSYRETIRKLTGNE
ncbi:LytR/AlgR family response regulator transcription factor [Larkinella rosea]|uniref:DNA-binding response regulator n=1 Tax=Larkinella rosea TaxID=2025312 RepID=A0A3P1BJ38_9BACT|nr:LytTR family DNA-binding domain-containing protein [Larkinella rosea]RRB01147.1 DNA-binding response regulator [Larkinella rosea]